MIEQAHRETQIVIQEAHGAKHREQQERRRMEAEGRTTIQTEQTTKQHI